MRLGSRLAGDLTGVWMWVVVGRICGEGGRKRAERFLKNHLDNGREMTKLSALLEREGSAGGKSRADCESGS